MATITCSWSTGAPDDAEVLRRVLQTLVEGSAEASLSGRPATEESPLVLTPPTSDAQAPPCELYVTVPAGHALDRVAVKSTARTVELHTASQPGSALQYSGSSGRGAPQEDGTWECVVTHDTETVPRAGMLRHGLSCFSVSSA